MILRDDDNSPGLIQDLGGFVYLVKPDGTRCLLDCGGGGGNTPSPANPGDMLYSSDGLTWTVLSVGADGEVLTVVAGVPDWAAAGTAFTPGDALDLNAGVLDVLYDGTSIQINGSNELEVVPGTVPPPDAEYVVMALSGGLTDERKLTAGDALLLTDGGAGGNALLDVLFDGTSIGLNSSNELTALGGSLTDAVILDPLTNTRNRINPAADVIPLSIYGSVGQTEDLLQMGVEPLAPMVRFAKEGAYSTWLVEQLLARAGDGYYDAADSGTYTGATPYTQLFLDLALNPAANSSNDHFGVGESIRYYGNKTAASFTGGYFEALFFGNKASGSGQQVGNVLGMQTFAGTDGSGATGDITSMSGLGTAAQVWDPVRILSEMHGVYTLAGDAGGSGLAIPEASGVKSVLQTAGRTITSGAGLLVETPFGTLSNFTNLYGVRIKTQTGAGTKSWGIKVEGGFNEFDAGVATEIPLTLRGFAAQSANLFVTEDSAGNDLVAITSAGRIVFGTSADTNLYRSTADTLKTDDSLVIGAALNHIGSTAGFLNATPVAQQAASTITALWTALKNYGLLTAGSASPGDITDAVILLPTTDARNVIQPSAATVTPLTIKGFTAQSDNLLEFRDSAAALLHDVTAAGVLEWGSAADVNLYRAGANQLKTDDAFLVGANYTIDPSGYWDGPEISVPSTPAANHGRLFWRDSGGGLTQLVAVFPSGNTVVVASDF